MFPLLGRGGRLSIQPAAEGGNALPVHAEHGIPLCRVCDRCRDEKLRGYNPWVLTGYNQGDVDEPIEPDGDY